MTEKTYSIPVWYACSETNKEKRNRSLVSLAIAMVLVLANVLCIPASFGIPSLLIFILWHAIYAELSSKNKIRKLQYRVETLESYHKAEHGYSLTDINCSKEQYDDWIKG